MIDLTDVFLRKAQESLEGAASEAANGRYNNCANRCYYACFQAAISALMRAGVQPSGTRGLWSHELVAAQFVGLLVNRRKLYPTELRQTVTQLYALRQDADYRITTVSQVQGERALRRARIFVTIIGEGQETRR